jgi:hypothetical protein
MNCERMTAITKREVKERLRTFGKKICNQSGASSHSFRTPKVVMKL